MKHDRLILLFLFGIFFSSLSYAAKDDSGSIVKWGYKGNLSPAYWGQLSPSFALCATGKSQSPINIPKKAKKIEGTLKINYQPAEMNIMDDGLTTLTINDSQTIFSDGHSVQLNFSNTKKEETIELDGTTYRLVELHFHSPSENAINGQTFPVEIHFVHQGENGKVAVIGVFAKGGDENQAVKKIIGHLPRDKGKTHVYSDEYINPIDLVPTKYRYYRFDGSLTTPPCTEGLKWVVMSEPITLSPAQIAILRKTMGGANARPLQPLHGRTVSIVKEKVS